MIKGKRPVVASNGEGNTCFVAKSGLDQFQPAFYGFSILASPQRIRGLGNGIVHHPAVLETDDTMC